MKRIAGPLGIGMVALLVIRYSLFASAAPYFEFNPDFSQSLLVASAPGAVSEVFLPLNEFMSGFDLWVSNNSIAGPVTFTLYNPTQGVLATRTLTVPAIADSENGTRFTVNLPAQEAVNGSLAYRIGIATTVPTLRVYYSQQSRILTHNGVPLPAYTGGLARIGSEDQGYSFKFALTENAETSAPVLSDVAVQQPAIGTAVISFFANEPVDAQLAYNTSVAPFSGQFSTCPTGIVPCSSTVLVTPGLNYSYTLTVRDVWGNETSATGTFTATGNPPDVTVNPSATPPISGTTITPSASPSGPPDISAPVISNLQAANITATSALIAWTTNEAANSLAVVQSLPFLISAGGGSDATFELEHLIAITGLDSEISYQARVTSSDQGGNVNIATISFQTLTLAPATPGPISSTTPSPVPVLVVTPTPTVSIGAPDGSGVSELTWSPPTGGAPVDGYRVDIIGADGKLIRSFRTTTTTVSVSNIPDGATIVVYAEHDGVFEKVGSPAKVRHVSLFERFLSALPYLLGVGIAIIAGTVVALAIRNKKKMPPPVTAPPVPPVRS